MSSLESTHGSNLLRTVALSSSFEPCIAVRVLCDLVRDLIDILLHLGICEFPADETLGSKEGIFWIDDCLALRRQTHDL